MFRDTRRSLAFLAFAFLAVVALTAPASPAAAASDTAADDAADDGAAYAAPIEAAHGLAAWNSHRALAGDIAVYFGGKLALEGRFVTDTPVGRMRFELTDGTLLVFDGERAWVSPATSIFQGARFHLRTWPYFLAAPMKLRDPGAHLEVLGTHKLDDRELPTARLTFGDAVGDSPDDWYVLYRDEKHRLAAMGYIVTYGNSVEKAEKEPHAITYGGFEKVGDTVLSTHWKFWLWNLEQGIHGDPIGEAKLSNLHFVEPEAGAFEQPADAREDALPTP